MKTIWNYSIVGTPVIGFILVLTLASADAQTFEGYLENTVTTKSTMPMQPSQQTKQQKAYYKPGKFKSIDLTSGEEIILRLDKEVFWSIDHKNKSYTEMTFAQMEQGLKNMRSAMEEHQKNMSPEEREALEKMMGKSLGKMFSEPSSFEISFKRTGKSKTILGYNCEQVMFNLDDEPIMEMWITSKLDIGNEWVEIYEKMGMMKFKFSSEARKLRGLPLVSKMDMDTGMGKIETITETTRVVKTAVADSEFEVPKGYKKKASEMPFDK